jgi:hypothetical protein
VSRRAIGRPDLTSITSGATGSFSYILTRIFHASYDQKVPTADLDFSSRSIDTAVAALDAYGSRLRSADRLDGTVQALSIDGWSHTDPTYPLGNPH